ncbi:MAG: TonB-dependent receptor [Myxococcota bacterium]
MNHPSSASWLLAVAVWCLSVSAFAQEADETPAEDPPRGNIDEFVVVGNSGARSFLEEEESVAIFNTEDIEQFGIQDVRDTFRLIPNTNSSPSNRGNNGITIRGINSEGIGGAGSNLRPLASLVIDGATQSFAGLRRGARGLWDVESIRVYRGPQSTLQGRNALAGVIFVETKDPTFEWEAAVSGGTAVLTNEHSALPNEPDRWDGAVMLSGPITESLAFRVTGEVFRDQHGISVLPTIAPDDPLRPRSGPDPRDTPEATRRRQKAMEELDEGEYQQVRAKLLFEPLWLQDLRIEVSASVSEDDPANPEVNEERGLSFRDYVISKIPEAAERRRSVVQNGVLNLTYDLAWDLRLRTVTSYTATDIEFDTPFPEAFLRNETRDDEDFAQDIRLEYVPDRSWSFSVGGYYARADNDTDSEIILRSTTILANRVQNQQTQRLVRNLAFFGEFTWEPFDWVELTGSLRWDRDKYTNRFLLRPLGLVDRPAFLMPNPDDIAAESRFETGSRSRTTTAWLPRVSLTVTPRKGHAVGFSVSRGYRSGFVNSSLLGISEAESEVDPEFVWVYEASYRGSFFGERVILSTNAFYYDWKDQQITRRQTFDAGADDVSLDVTENAGRSRLYGVEAVGQFNLYEGLFLTATVGLLETELVRYVVGQTDLSGNEFSEAPNRSAALLLSYQFPSGWYISGDWSYRGPFFGTSDLNNANQLTVRSRQLYNVRVGLNRGSMDLSFFVRNIFDKRYVTGRDNFGGVYVGDRRSVGVNLTFRFSERDFE